MSTPVAQPVQATAAAPKLDDQPIPSIYTEQLAYERAIADAAEQLARGRRFRWERELLAVAGIVLLIDTILKLISLLDPDIIVVGGGVSQIGEPLFARLRRIAPARTINQFAYATPIVPAQLGANAGVLGAAAVVLT